MEKILDKQFLLTGYLELLLKAHFSIGDTDVPSTTVITPEDVTERGSQLSLEFSYPLHQVHKELQKRGVVVSFLALDLFVYSVIWLPL